MAGLTTAQTRDMLLHVAAGMQASADQLTQADKAIGDGDHGVGMARGFAAVQAALAGREYAGLDELLRTVGTTLMSSVGGASGAIFGTFFRGAARGVVEAPALDGVALAAMLAAGLQAVRKRGKAGPGDKTMVDVLLPAAERAAELAQAPLAEALAGVVEAAAAGVEATRGMIANVGKAKTLGERSLGQPDPGGLSTYLMLRLMLEYVQKTAGTAPR